MAQAQPKSSVPQRNVVSAVLIGIIGFIAACVVILAVYTRIDFLRNQNLPTDQQQIANFGDFILGLLQFVTGVVGIVLSVIVQIVHRKQRDIYFKVATAAIAVIAIVFVSDFI